MSTHEIKAKDLSWPTFQLDSMEDAWKHADKLERMAADPSLSDDQRDAIDEQLDELFSLLFDSAF